MATRPARVQHGAVFTHRWVVEHMLDLADYTVDRDLTTERVLEPSIGEGAFVGPIIERLLASRAAQHPDAPWIELADCIRGWDLQETHVETVRKTAFVALTNAGCPQPVADVLTEQWFRVGDFLLADLQGWTAALVVGNPPYIRLEDQPSELLAAYRRQCKTMRGRADVYVGFIERTLTALAPDGRQVFICADRWMHNEYGKALRSLVIDSYAVDTVLKLHGVNAFEGDVDAYPAITTIRRGRQGKVAIGEATPDFGPADAKEFLAFARSRKKKLSKPRLTAARLAHWHTSDELWPQGSFELLDWLADLQVRHVPLERADGRTELGIGVATGRDEVYIVGPDKVPAVEPDRLLPLAHPDDLKTGRFKWSGRYLVNPWRQDGAGLIDLADYPKTARYLRRHKRWLKARACVNKIKNKARRAATWHKTIDRVHQERAEVPYLALEDMKAYSHPVLIPAGFYPVHALYAIRSEEWDLAVLGGVLISEAFERQVAAYCVRMRGQTLRFQAQYLRMCRVPAPETIPSHIATELATAFELRDRKRATAAALRAYGITSIPA